MQVVPQITNTNGYPTTLVPLLFVLFISGVFKALEDIARHKADAKANSSIALKYNEQDHKFHEIRWANVQVGDYIKVNSRETIPADMIIIQVSEPNPDSPKGICYVETKSLDGETNLKMRQVLPFMLKKVSALTMNVVF